MTITVKDIAKLVGVSHVTVIRAINGSPKVSPRTREKVLAVAKEHNYVANSFARNLAGNKSNTIGLLVTDISNPVFAEITRGVDDMLAATDYRTIIYNYDNKPELACKGLQSMRELRVGGVLIALPSEDTAMMHEHLDRLTMPYVLLSRNSIRQNDFVAFDDRLGGYLIGKHLIELGHRNIACVMPLSPTTQPSGFRLEGLRLALGEVGGALPAERIVSVGFGCSEGYRSAEVVLRMEGITAIVCFNDTLAIGMMRRLKELGKAIPEDIAVTGFDDNEINPYLETTLTSINLPKYALGQRSAQLLLKRLEADKDSNAAIEQIVIEPTLHVRESTAGNIQR